MTGWLLLILPGMIWGASFLFIAEGLRSVGPLGLTFLRILIGFCTLSLYPPARRPIARQDLVQVLLLGLIWFAFPLSLFPFAEQRVSSAFTGMLNGSNPLFSTMVACLFTRRLPSRGVVLGLAVGISGTVLLAAPAFGQGESSIAGVAMIIVALISYAVSISVAHGVQARNGAAPVIWRAQAMGVLLMAPLAVPDLRKAHWMTTPVLSILALGAGGTAIAFVLLAISIRRYGASRASATIFLTPVVALALGVLILHERVAPISVAGCFVCLLGAGIMKRSASH